jgi:hypothetical protein
VNRFRGIIIVVLLIAMWLTADWLMYRRTVRPDELATLIDRSDKVVILGSPMSGAPVLYESKERQDLDALKWATRVSVPDEDVHCLCLGSPAIDLYSRGQRIGRITNHHAKLLRCELWKSDAPLLDSEAFLKWFDDRKIAGPRAEWDDAIKRQQQREAERQRWLDAMPKALKPLWPTVEQSFDADVTPLDHAMAKEFPDEQDRIRALLSWYGSGAGPWSGHPAYEGVAESLLLRYPTRSLLTAIEGRELSPTQTEGAARLFGGWSFSQARPNDLRLLQEELKQRLLAHSLKSSDEDKRARAQCAFQDR